MLKVYKLDHISLLQRESKIVVVAEDITTARIMIREQIEGEYNIDLNEHVKEVDLTVAQVVVG